MYTSLLFNFNKYASVALTNLGAFCFLNSVRRVFLKSSMIVLGAVILSNNFIAKCNSAASYFFISNNFVLLPLLPFPVFLLFQMKTHVQIFYRILYKQY